MPDEHWYAAGDPWVLSQTEWTPERNIYFETIFTQSNGYIGVRGYTEETDPTLESCREGYLAGVFGHTDDAALAQTRVTYPWPMLAMITLPELFACDMQLAGEPLRLSDGKVLSFHRTLDMRNGELVREVVWESPEGRRTRLVFKRFLSAANPHLGMQEISVAPESWSGAAALRFDLDGNIPTYFRCGDRTMAHVPQEILEEQRIERQDGQAATLTVKTRGTNHTVAITSGLTGEVCTSGEATPGALSQSVALALEEGRATTVLHTVAVVSSRDDVDAAQVPALSVRTARDAARSGYAAALAESSAVWEQRWVKSDIAIDGPARDQAYTRFSCFSMLQMAPFHTDNISVPARAYAYNRYHGLYYWDSETFLLPQYLYSHPKVAENLLSFRYRTLGGARRTAKQLGAPGACFPWMTDSDDGTEQSPWHIGDYVWHQNADIAYAIEQYVRTTGDTGFMKTKGLEMMVESARFWMSRLEEEDEGVVHLHNTVGPDELDTHGRDNGYTSLMARRHLRLAAGWIEELAELYPDDAATLVEKLNLTREEAELWLRAADRLSAPNVPGLDADVPLQDEFLLGKKPLDFRGLTADEAYAMRHTHRVVKQADIVLLMYLLQDEFTVEQMKAAYEFYEPLTLHFSSLSYSTHAILANKIGLEAQAYDYFLKGAGLDLDDLRDATQDGLHAAALGGTWQTIVYGFVGMRLLKDGLVLEPRLPTPWKSVTLAIIYRGFRLKMTLSHDQNRIEVEGAEGMAPAEVVLDGEAHTLKDGLQIAQAAKA
ncbi:MAG: hypothetical protein AMK73_02355 [Planctomycetes bacterium SM23_32]|nr:MAG: hypothetical protein AMK73_02355 [Planctomycetes bacterium SM23_32]